MKKKKAGIGDESEKEGVSDVHDDAEAAVDSADDAGDADAEPEADGDGSDASAEAEAEAEAEADGDGDGDGNAGADAEHEEEDDGSDADVDSEDDVVDDPVNPKVKLSLIDPADGKRLPLSILAGIVGAGFGIVIIALLSYLIDSVFFPLFVIGPLLICFFNYVFNGARDIRAFIVIVVFSLLFLYTAELSGRAALYVRMFDGLSVFRIPALVAEAFGRFDAFSRSASANIFPLVFTVLGVFISWEILRAGRVKSSESGNEDEADNEDEDSTDSEDNTDDEDEDSADSEFNSDDEDEDSADVEVNAEDEDDASAENSAEDEDKVSG